MPKYNDSHLFVITTFMASKYNDNVSARTLSSILIGITGIFLLGVGLTTFGLTSSPRPSNLSPDLYSRLRQLEWVVTFLFIPLGMWMLRMMIVRFNNQKAEE